MITAADLMTKSVLSVTPETSIADVANVILKHRFSALPVVDEANHLVGIVSEGDLVRCARAKRAPHRSWWLALLKSSKAQPHHYLGEVGRTVADVMSRDVLLASHDETLPHLISLLARSRIKRLPIVADGKLIGIVSRVDVLRYLAETFARTGSLAA
jgi:CBS-domain-containing membrane protein